MEHRRGIYFVLFLIAWMLIFLFAVDSLRIIGIDLREELALPWFVIFTQVIGFLVPLGVWLSIFKEKLNMHLPHMKLGTTNVLLIVGISFFIQPAINVLSFLTSFIFPNEVSLLFLDALTAYPYWLLILAIAITPAICEEVVFRGYIQSTYRNKPFLTMAIANGLFFAIMHFSPHQFAYTFIMGIVFVYMVHVTQSIRAGIISHFIVNATQVTLMWGMARLAQIREQMEVYPEIYEIEPDRVTPMEMLSDPMFLAVLVFFGLIAIGCTIFAAHLFHVFAKHNRKRFEEYNLKQKEKLTTEEEFLKIIEPPIPENTSSDGNEEKNFALDAALILVIVVMYVILVL